MARDNAGTLTMTGIGTPTYMAPGTIIQINNQKVQVLMLFSLPEMLKGRKYSDVRTTCCSSPFFFSVLLFRISFHY